MRIIKNAKNLIILSVFLSMLSVSCKKDDAKLWLKPSIDAQYFSVNENSAVGTIIDTVVLSNPNKETIEYSIIGGNENDFFAIDSKTGVISVNNGANLNFEKKPEYNLTIEVTSSESKLTSNAPIKITVADLNEIPLTGLVGSYNFNGNLNDNSGNSYNAVNSGTTYAIDRLNSSNQAVDFNGISGYLKLPFDFDYKERSISLWFNAKNIPVFDYVNNPNTSWGSLITCDHPALQYGSLNVCVSRVDGVDKVWCFEGGMDTQANPNLLTTVINANEWNNLTLTLSDLMVKLYLNGCLINSFKTAKLNSVNGNPNMMIGTSRVANGRFFSGKIDDLLIYNRILTADEVKTIYLE